MLNCLVNSIFHILFCIALAKVLKSSAVSSELSVCDLCLPFSSPFFFIHHLIHHEKIFLAGNSDSALICEAFQFIAFSLCWGLRCGAPLFLQLWPHYTGIHASSVGFHLSLAKLCATYTFKFVCSPKAGTPISHLNPSPHSRTLPEGLRILNMAPWNEIELLWASLELALCISISRMVESHEAEHQKKSTGLPKQNTNSAYFSSLRKIKV